MRNWNPPKLGDGFTRSRGPSEWKPPPITQGRGKPLEAGRWSPPPLSKVWRPPAVNADPVDTEEAWRPPTPPFDVRGERDGNPPRSPSPQKQTLPLAGVVAGGVLLVGLIVLLGYPPIRDRTLRRTGSPAGTPVYFEVALDGRALTADQLPEINVDGRPFQSGNGIGKGKHQITVLLNDAEPFSQKFWVLFGAKRLGTLQLQSSKGSLTVTVSPSPAKLVLQRFGKLVKEADATLKLEQIQVGDFVLMVRRGEYTETHPVRILRHERTEVAIELNLGSLDVASTPNDAQFELSRNGGQWQGELPAHLEDVPVGSYMLTASRKGWQQEQSVVVSRGRTATNIIEFPYGSIEMTSDPTGVTITTNGVNLGKTPLVLRELRPGSYALTAKDGENEMTLIARVEPRATVKKDFAFRYGVVEIVTTPLGATVVSRGRVLGKTPLSLNRVPAGELSFQLGCEGYASTNLSIPVVEGVTNSCTARLISARYIEAIRGAREALIAAQFPESQRLLRVALECEPNDIEALKLSDEVASSVVKAEALRKEAERKAEEDRKDAARTEVTAVIEKAIKSMGGHEAINRLKSCKAIYRSSGKNNNIDFEMRVTAYMQLPDKLRIDQEIANQPKTIGPLVITSNGGKPTLSTFCVTEADSWELVPGLLGITVRRAVSQNVQDQLRRTLYLTECSRLVTLLGADFALEKIPSTTSTPDGAITIRARKNGKPDVILFFDSTSGRLLGMDSEEPDGQGNSKKSSIRYSGYRSFSGMNYPAVSTYLREGGTSSTSTVESLSSMNSAEQVFSPPAR